MPPANLTPPPPTRFIGILSGVFVLSGLALLLVAVRTDWIHRELPVEWERANTLSVDDLEPPSGELDNLYGFSPNGRDWIYATLGNESTRLWGDFRIVQAPEGVPWIVATNDSGEILFHPDGTPVTLMGPDVRLRLEEGAGKVTALDSAGAGPFTRSEPPRSGGER